MKKEWIAKILSPLGEVDHIVFYAAQVIHVDDSSFTVDDIHLTFNHSTVVEVVLGTKTNWQNVT